MAMERNAERDSEEATEQLLPSYRREKADGQAFPPGLVPRLGRSIIVHIVIILAYTILYLIAIRSTPGCLLPPQIWSPATESIVWQARPVDGVDASARYSGKPSPEIDSAWHDLLKNMGIRIFPDEMARIGSKSLAFADASGYLGSLSVYHQLHCLKRIRWWVYRDHYYSNITSEERVQMSGHVDHCIELLRQSAVCKSDTSIIPYKWMQTGDKPGDVKPTIQDGAMHQCVRWEALQDWASERRVDMFDVDLLERPT